MIMMKQLRPKRIVPYIGTGVLLLLGACIYYVFFPEVLFVRKIDELIGRHLIKVNFNKKLIIIQLMRYYLMDFIWSCSLTCFISGIIGFGRKERKTCGLILIAFVLFMECIQMIDGILGTFDLNDIVVELCGISITYLIIKEREVSR